MTKNNSLARSWMAWASFITFLFSSSFSYADTCGFNPDPYLNSYRVDGKTKISLVSVTPNPIDSLSTVTLQINNSAVSVTETWVQPGDYNETQICDEWGCYVVCAWQLGYNFKRPNLYYPSGTAIVRQNGVTLGTVAVHGSSATYTAPPTQSAGSFDFVVGFTPTIDKFSSTTSNILTVMANLNSGVLMSIITTILSE